MGLNTNRIIEIVLIVEIVLPFVMIPFVWGNLPNELDFHWGLSDAYIFPKSMILFGIPVMNAIIWLFFLLLSKNKYINDGISFFNRKYHFLRLALSSILFAYFVIVILINY